MGKADDEPQNDLALVLDKAENSDGYRVLRRRAADSAVELGTIRPLKEGRPIEGEVVSLQRREDVPFLYDLKTELPDQRPVAAAATGDKRLTSDGPPQIATEQYRRGWEAIWGQATGELPATAVRSDKPN
jgi:hypothetical protein